MSEMPDNSLQPWRNTGMLRDGPRMRRGFHLLLRSILELRREPGLGSPPVAELAAVGWYHGEEHYAKVG
jgi:hypothetical protein